MEKLKKIKQIDSYRDGGTKIYVDEEGKQYFEDQRIGTATRGEFFDLYPGNKDARKVHGKFEIVKDFREKRNIVTK